MKVCSRMALIEVCPLIIVNAFFPVAGTVKRRPGLKRIKRTTAANIY